MTTGISRSVPRVDAHDKAAGITRYIADIPVPGTLYGKLVRTSICRGTILDIKVPDLPEGFRFISEPDIPEGGKNLIHMIKEDWPVFTNSEVRFYGQTIGILVGSDREQLIALADAVKVTYREQEAAFTIEEGIACKGGPLHGTDNLFADFRLVKGDPDSAFSRAHRVIEDVIETGFQEHVYMEPQGITVEEQDGKIIIHASCQCPFYIRKAAAPSLNRNLEDIIVRQAVTGGGFGGKEHFPDIIACAAAVAVTNVHRPVQVIFDREEDMLYSTKRHPSQVIFRTALDHAGRIIAMDIDARINAGAYESCSPVVLQRLIFSSNSVYDIPNVRLRGRAVATSTIPSDAFRGFGAPQGIIAAELHMSHIARKIGVDEVELKRSLMVSQGSRTITNGTIHETVMLNQMWERIAEVSLWSEKSRLYKPGLGRGMGVAFYLHGGGFTGSGEQDIINARVRMVKQVDGTVELLLSNVEMGQGLQTTFRKIAAQVLGCSYRDVVLDEPATDRVPDSGPTVASRSIMVVGRLVQLAAEQLKQKIHEPGVQESEVAYEHPPGYQWDQDTLQGDAYPAYSWGICVTEVAVDPDTCEVETVGVWTIHEIGKAIDEAIVHGQVTGGVIQALGYGSLEKLELKDGRFYQHTMADYSIPTTLDFPEVYSELVENPYPFGPFGAKGLGELVFDGAAASYAMAVQHAVDRKVSRIPVTPEYIMELKNHG